MLKKVFHEYYIESLVKEGLAYLFDYNFLVTTNILEKHIIINKNATTAYKILGIPKKIISYIRENRLNSAAISSMQNFFIVNNYDDFQALVLNNDSVFTVSDLDQLNTLISYGYSAYKLNKYAQKIMKDENLTKRDFFNYIISGVKMSRSLTLKFKLYAKKLKKRHKELVYNYKHR
jgi:hypothetical protein